MVSIRTPEGEQTLTFGEFERWIREGRIAPTTPVCFPVLTGDRWVEAGALEVFRRLYEPARIHFRRSFSLGGFPLLSAALVLLLTLLFLGLSGDRGSSVDKLIAHGAKNPPNILELGETWRLWTANLLHRDWLHLLFNAFFLLNVGGTIENAYRKQDYLLILVVSGLGTTCVSTLCSSVPSVGSSGIVLGLFGAASVFGQKYAEILPRRYRAYFLWGVLPYALFVLYVGLVASDTDNWGHLGGLVGGALVALFLKPKLLHGLEPGGSAPLYVAAGLAAATVAAGVLIRLSGPPLTTLRDLDHGIEVAVPGRWVRGTNHLGYPAVGNSLGVNFGLRVLREPRRPFLPDRLEARFRSEELGAAERAGEVTGVRMRGTRPLILPKAAGVALAIRVDTRAGSLETSNLLIARGRIAYVLVLSVPVAYAEDYRELFAQIEASIALFEPRTSAQSRALVAALPGMTSAHVEWAEALLEVGDAAGARAAYRAALITDDADPAALLGLANLALDFPDASDEAERAVEKLCLERPNDPRVRVLVAELYQRRGENEVARRLLAVALERVPELGQFDPLRRTSP